MDHHHSASTPPTPASGLVASNLGKSFKQRPVVRGVSVSVQRGEAVGLLDIDGAADAGHGGAEGVHEGGEQHGEDADGNDGLQQGEGGVAGGVGAVHGLEESDVVAVFEDLEGVAEQ